VKITTHFSWPRYHGLQSEFLPSILLPPPRRICNRHCMSVCLSVCNFAQKLQNRFAWNFQGALAMGQVNRWLNFGGSPFHHLDTGIVFWIRHYWEIWKVHPVIHSYWFAICQQWLLLSWKIPKDSPDGGTDITTLVRHDLVEVCTVPVFLVKHVTAVGQYFSNYSLLTLVQYLIGKLSVATLYRHSSLRDRSLYFWEISS